jgi:hypothetical protein
MLCTVAVSPLSVIIGAITMCLWYIAGAWEWARKPARSSAWPRMNARPGQSRTASSVQQSIQASSLP